MTISLLSVRIVLGALGAQDYGLYNLIAGVIALLSFLNGAMVVSTQRYLSVCLGARDDLQLGAIFNTSFTIHLFLGGFLMILLEILGIFLFDGFLNISADKIIVARTIYQLMIVSTIITVIGAPFNALINAHEDMWFFSIIDVSSSFLKLASACYLLITSYNPLIIYSVLNVLIIITQFSVKYLWCRKRYIESKLRIIKAYNKPLFKEMVGYIGWNTLGAAAITIRNQGVAVVLNLFFGTALNAAYGVANQVNAQLMYFSQVMLASLSPQIMKSKGEGNRQRMIELSLFASKFSFFLSASLAIPVLIELPLIFNIWLKVVPEYSIIFCRLIICLFLIMQIYAGLVRTLQAEGKIKSYQITIFIVLILPIVIGYIIFSNNYPPYAILIVSIIFQIVAFMATLYYCKIYVGLNISNYFSLVLFKSLVIFSFAFLVGVVAHYLIADDLFRVITVGLSSTVSFSILYYYHGFIQKERNAFVGILKTIKKKFIKGRKYDQTIKTYPKIY